KRLPSMSISSAPSPRSMNNGSRPIAPIARTGELTPPGSRRSARLYSSADLESVREAITGLRSSVPALPVLELLGEVQQPDLLELGRGVESRAARDPCLLRDRM